MPSWATAPLTCSGMGGRSIALRILDGSISPRWGLTEGSRSDRVLVNATFVRDLGEAGGRTNRDRCPHRTPWMATVPAREPALAGSRGLAQVLAGNELTLHLSGVATGRGRAEAPRRALQRGEPGQMSTTSPATSQRMARTAIVYRADLLRPCPQSAPTQSCYTATCPAEEALLGWG